MSDELLEINGIKPAIWLEDGEEKEVGSSSSKSVYKIKRTFDHYYCTCPAWRNQSGAPVNARSCKHIKSLLGEKYEEARLLLKNPDDPPPKAAKGAAKAKAKAPAKAAKAAPKRKKPVDEDEEDDDDEEGEEKVKPPPAKRARKPASTTKTAKGKGRGKKIVEDDEEENEEEDQKVKPPPARKAHKPASTTASAKGANEKVKDEGEDEEKDDNVAMDVDEDVKKKPQSKAKPTEADHDELAEINGIKPKVLLANGEEHEIKSLTSKTVYKVKRTLDHFCCTCPAWRNQSGIRINARTCKHIQDLLGEDYEAARLKLKNPNGPQLKGANTKAVPRKAVAKRKKVKEDQEDVEDDEDEDVKPAPGKAHKPASTTKALGKVKEEEAEEEDEEDLEGKDEGDENEGEEDDDGVDDGEAKPAADDGDELAVINGIKPKAIIKDGDEREVKSMTSNSVYKVKRTWDHYYCTCPAWRNQGGVPVNARTCKHLQSILGNEYEAARLKLKNPEGPPPKGAKAKPVSKAKGKSAAKKKGAEDDEDGEGDDDDEGGATSGKSVPELLLAVKWDLENGPDPKGWWISEKLDGVRTFYDGKQMISRLGNPFTPPQWFLDKLPKDINLDGELFGGRGQFQSTVSIVKTINSPHWKGISFQIFDIPSRASEPFEDRIAFLKELFGEGGTHATEQIAVVKHEAARDREHVLEKLKEIESLGGEGVMLRKPASQYEGFRSNSLQKVKTFYDAEAIVTGYMPGKGRNAGTTGALKCKMASGKTFNVGSGLNDKQRRNPPKIDSIIVYRFQELTHDGVPRFPSYIGEAIDKTVPKDAEIPEHRKGNAKTTDE